MAMRKSDRNPVARSGLIPLEKRRNSSGILKRFIRTENGATAIEFALLIIPFMVIVLATFETFIAFTGEQLVANATNELARKVRTGEITFNMGRSTDMDRTQFRTEFCNRISILISCSATEAATPAKLYIDLQKVSSFASIPKTVPLKSTNGGKGQDLDTSGFAYSPGGASTINMMRVYYRWSILTDLVRPYISNIRPEGQSSDSQFLIVATTAFQNENYP
jgi:Flp pilus assembly protein TadG